MFCIIMEYTIADLNWPIYFRNGVKQSYILINVRDGYRCLQPVVHHPVLLFVYALHTRVAISYSHC
jgi:hypothetical protein